MTKQFALRVMVLTLIALVGCSAPPTATPMPTIAPTATSAPPTITPVPTMAPTTPLTPTRVSPTATLAPTATSVPPSPTTTKQVTASLTWLGHSTFILKTSTGLTALLDPMDKSVGYPVTPVNGVDLVTASHEHADHNNVALAAGTPSVLRGLAGQDWAKIDQTIKEVRVRTVNAYHDDTQGSQRGKNSIFIFELDGLKIAHLGDLGAKLDTEQLKALGVVDIVLIPVGGFFTVDGKGAAEVVAQINPKGIVPMHYKTPDLGASLAGRLADTESFIAALGSSIKVEKAGQTITFSSSQLPATRTLYNLNYK